LLLREIRRRSDESFGRVFRTLGLEPTSVTEKAKKLVVSNPTHDLNSSRPWHAPFSEAEGEAVRRICDDFGLRLYGREKMPLCTPRQLVDSAFADRHPRGGSTVKPGNNDENRPFLVASDRSLGSAHPSVPG
jgi:hypothetical protein